MGWLTGYAYRMEAPVANPYGVGDRLLTIPFPAMFLRNHPDGAKILDASYNDVHVTKSDGTTELPCTLNAAKTSLQVDWASMPQGPTSVYVYYGKSGASAPTAASFTASTATETGGTVSDSFDGGSNGSNLSTPWTRTIVGGASATYSNTVAVTGTLSGKLATGSTTNDYAQISETASAGMTADTAERRWWMRMDSAASGAMIQMYEEPATSSSCLYLEWDNGGMRTYVDRAGLSAPFNATGYTTLDTNASYSANTWYQFRIVYNFTAKTFRLYRRTALGDAWTSIGKSSTYDIPMRGGSVTQSGGMRIFAYKNSTGGAVNCYIDQHQYANGGITDAPGTSAVQCMKADWEVTSEGDTSPTVYVWGDDLDATYIASDATTTGYGAASTFAAGISTGGVKYHALVKPLEASLALGTTSAARLHVNIDATSSVGAGGMELRAHRLKNYGEDSADGTTRHERWVRTGWSVDAVQQTGNTNGFPTWNSRYYSRAQGAAIAWQTAGATNSNEIDSASYQATTIGASPSTGYRALTLDPTWFDDWQGDSYSSGILIKDSTDTAGAVHRYVVMTAPSQTNSPVLEVNYSSVSGDQLAVRKLSSDTSQNSTFAVQNRYCLTPSAYSFAYFGLVNAEYGMDLFYINAAGRIHRAVKNYKPNHGSSTEFSIQSPGYGLHYDTVTGRLWVGGTGDYLQIPFIAYTNPYVLSTPTTVGVTGSPIGAIKSTFLVANDVAYLVIPSGTDTSSPYDRLKYYTYTRGTGAWTGPTNLYLSDPPARSGGTQRTVDTGHAIGSGDVMDGAGVIYANGTITDYPSSGGLVIDNEFFWYTGKSGNTFTGVSRGMWVSTKAAHSVGATIKADGAQSSYPALSFNSDNTKLRLMWSDVTFAQQSDPYTNTSYASAGQYGYTRVNFMELDVASSTWKDAAGTSITLPARQNTVTLVSRADSPAYGTNLASLSTGDTLVAFAENVAPINPTTLATFRASNLYGSRVARRASGGTSFSTADLQDMAEVSLVDLGSSYVVASGVTGNSVKRSASFDGGASWATSADVKTHSFAAPADFTNWATSLWQSNSTEQGNLSGRGLVYWTHFAHHGAVFVNALVYPVTVTYTADAKIASKVTYTADAVIASRPTTTYTADAVILGTTEKTYTADAIVQAAGTVTYTADAIVQDFTHTKTYTADAIVFGTSVLTYTADARIEAESGAATRALSWFFRRRRSNMATTKTYTQVQAKGTTRTATWTSPTYEARTEAGILVVLDVTAASGTGGLTLRINAHDLAGSVAVPLNSAPTAVTATGTTSYSVYPFGAISGALTQSTSGYLPRQFSITVTHGDSSSYTYSVGFSLLP